jgi:hypothetical protein
LRRHEIQSGTSEGPYGRGRSEVLRNNEEAAQGLASSCKAMQRAKGTDTRRIWILEEFGRCLQEGDPSCSSGTVQEKRLQENSDPGKLWTTEGIGRSLEEGAYSIKLLLVSSWFFGASSNIVG